MKKKDTALSSAEWTLMQVLWRGGKMSIREIMDCIGEETGWTIHSVISFLKRMEVKGAIAIHEERPIKYSALLDRDDAVKSETKELLGRIYGGEKLLMIKCAVDAEPLSDEEREELITLLKGGEL